MSLCRLIFDEVAPGRDFHAALAVPPRRAEAMPHTHDFSEMMYVLDGSGTHWINGKEQTLRGGDLLWIRAADCHTMFIRPGQKLHFINIAFRESAWEDFRRVALQLSKPAPWETETEPRSVHVSPSRRAECAALFQEALRGWQRSPTRLDLCRFWCGVLPMIGSRETVPFSPFPAGEGGAQREGAFPSGDAPLWLTRACLEMENEDALRVGLPCLVEKCGVSPAHLGRTLKTATGQTPTEFVNSLRLNHAAILLATTPQEITGIALDCGFENLSYFYRLFGRRYGASPRKYRQDARRAVMP